MEIVLKYLTVFALAAVKFMVAPASGFGLGLRFWEVLIITIIGGFVGFLFFYNTANYFMALAYKRRHKKIDEKGFKATKTFTRTNKLIVKIKRFKFGYWLLIFLTPCILSIPLGSIIMAKFYSERKGTYARMFLSVVVLGFIYTYFSDIIVRLFK